MTDPVSQRTGVVSAQAYYGGWKTLITMIPLWGPLFATLAAVAFYDLITLLEFMSTIEGESVLLITPLFVMVGVMLLVGAAVSRRIYVYQFAYTLTIVSLGLSFAGLMLTDTSTVYTPLIGITFALAIIAIGGITTITAFDVEVSEE